MLGVLKIITLLDKIKDFDLNGSWHYDSANANCSICNTKVGTYYLVVDAHTRQAARYQTNQNNFWQIKYVIVCSKTCFEYFKFLKRKVLSIVYFILIN